MTISRETAGSRRRRPAGAAVAIALVALSLAVLTLVALAAGGEPAGPITDPGATWTMARPGYAWSFPRDHWPHRSYRTEWWYFTGHLRPAEGEPPGAPGRDGPGEEIGYQLTFFRIGLLEDRPGLASGWASGTLVMGHAALTEASRGRHRFSDLLYREIPLLGGFGAFPDPLVAWARGPAGTAGTWSLRWNGAAFDLQARDDREGFGFRLSTRPAKPIVLQGEGGYSRKGREPGAASLYYSFTRLETEGTLLVDGVSRRVRGLSWMDREFGSSQLGKDQVGWDWFSLQLDDGRDLMLYALRGRDGRDDFKSGTLVSPGGAARRLEGAEWRARAIRGWTSPRTGAVYPSRFVVEVPAAGLRLEVVPRLADQENRPRLSGGPFYWEGSAAVLAPDGRQVGRGYVELTGYGEDNRPPV